MADKNTLRYREVFCMMYTKAMSSAINHKGKSAENRRICSCD